jgi:hypothetical protein
MAGVKVSIGVGLGSAELRVVLVRQGRVETVVERQLDPARDLSSALAEALAALRLPLWRRPRVVVALGPSRAQLRYVSGLPETSDAQQLQQIVREGRDRFFLRSGGPVLTTPVRMEAPGAVWCAALDEESVRAVELGCRLARHRMAAAVPALAVLPLAYGDGEIRWQDGNATTAVEAVDGGVVAIRRFVSDTALRAAELLPDLIESAMPAHLADAFGAARMREDEPLALRTRALAALTPDPAPWRLAIATLACVAALAFYAVAPSWRLAAAGDAAAQRLARSAAVRARAGTARSDLDEVSGALAQVSTFAASRRSPVLLLAAIGHALPPGSALVSFHVDTAAGSLVALTPRAATVVSALETVPGLATPEIAGAVTQEVASGRRVERVNVRFSLAVVSQSRAGP